MFYRPFFFATICLFTTGVGFSDLVWSDEFDGAAINKNVWTFDVGGHGFGNGELQYHTARSENAYIENGNLVIEARRENYGGKSFTSARLKTHGRFAFKYGTIEARIKIPNLANGLWPAFWLMGENIGQVGWPRCGEVDILEMGMKSAIDAGLTNRRISAGAFWDYQSNNANYSAHIDAAVNLNNDYHLYKLVWTPTLMAAYLDGVQIWAMTINNPASSLEEFHLPMFIIINLSVGGSNFVQITDPALITASFPAKMYIDWIRVSDNGSTELKQTADTAETGNFGILTETTPVNNAVSFGVQEDLFIWNNMTATTTTPYEGSTAWSFDVAGGAWFGFGVANRTNRNMQYYSDGNLHFQMKTTTTLPISVGIASAAGEGWADNLDMYGLVRDGAWHSVVIPLNRIAGNVDFHTIEQIFMLKGAAPGAGFNISLDDVYWEQDVTRPTPQHGNYGIYTEDENHKTAGSYALGIEGEFYVWENTLTPAAQHPYEGSGCMSFTSTPGPAWFGAAYTPFVKLNLSAFRFPDSKLHFAMKTTSATTFQIGMKSGNIDGIGQKWITFQNGSDPYGFVRDGQWHVVEIPMTDISSDVDLTEVSQIFELLGTTGAISNIEIDDICLLNGGAAIPQGGGPVAPTISVTSPANGATFSPGSDITLTADAAVADANIVQVEFFEGTRLLGTDTTSPYSITWQEAPAGDYILTARAIADNGIDAVSSPVAVYLGPADLNGDGTVDMADLAMLAAHWLRDDCDSTYDDCGGADYQPDGDVNMEDLNHLSLYWQSCANAVPTVAITSPADGATFTGAGRITIDVTASDSDGTISKVDFYRGTTLLGTDTIAPYSYSWSSTIGSHSLTAAATDNGGATAISAAVGVTVNPAPNVPPVVSITSPANGAVFAAPASITINASATDSDGTITQVDFYQGTTWLSTDTISPYSYTWNGVAAGNYTLTAVATDNEGAITISEAIGVASVNIGSNIALGRAATASSGVASRAVDGSMTTRWESAFSDPQWICIDLGATATINQVQLEWEAAYASSYEIQTSSDAQTWTTVFSTTTGNGGNDTITLSASARYVRMYGIVRSTVYGYSLWEFKVFGTGVPALLSAGKTAAASSGNAALAVDGSMGTRWESAFSDPQWIYVDLGATYTIAQIVLEWETAYGRTYQIQTAESPDGPWTDIYSTTTGDGGNDTLEVSGSGRYVRMYGTVRGTGWGYSLFEFKVYGN